GGYGQQGHAVPLGVAGQPRAAEQRSGALEHSEAGSCVGGLDGDPDEAMVGAWVEADEPGAKGSLALDRGAPEQVGEQGVDLALAMAGRPPASGDGQRDGHRRSLEDGPQLRVGQAWPSSGASMQVAPGA